MHAVDFPKKLAETLSSLRVANGEADFYRKQMQLAKGIFIAQTGQVRADCEATLVAERVKHETQIRYYQAALHRQQMDLDALRGVTGGCGAATEVKTGRVIRIL